MQVGDIRYALITDEKGCVLNDPIALKVADDRFWISIGDSDMLLWIKAIALGKSLNVDVTEAEVAQCALQGPKSHLVLQDLLGDWVLDLEYYRFKQTFLDGIPLLLARSGWCPERGYELYLQDESRGNELWEKLMKAGKKYGIQPGVVNHIRRIEGGLLSYGADITPEHNAFEIPLPDDMISLDKPGGFIGQDALKRLLASGGPFRKVVGLEFPNGANPGTVFKKWALRDLGGRKIGRVSSACYSPMLGTHIGIATVGIKHAKEGTSVIVQTGFGPIEAQVRSLPFMPV